MDLYNSFHDLVDLVWGPNDNLVDPSPDGIGFYWRPPEGDIRVDLVCKDGKLESERKDVPIGGGMDRRHAIDESVPRLYRHQDWREDPICARKREGQVQIVDVSCEQLRSTGRRIRE